MRSHNLVADGQSKPRAPIMIASGFVSTPESFKDLILLFCIKSNSVIANFDPDIVTAIARRDRDLSSLRFAIVNGIA